MFINPMVGRHRTLWQHPKPERNSLLACRFQVILSYKGRALNCLKLDFQPRCTAMIPSALPVKHLYKYSSSRLAIFTPKKAVVYLKTWGIFFGLPSDIIESRKLVYPVVANYSINAWPSCECPLFWQTYSTVTCHVAISFSYLILVFHFPHLLH